MKRSIIVSDYRGSRESIHTERNYFLLFVMLKYALQGARVFYLFSFSQADWVYRHLGVNVYSWTKWRTTVQFEYYVPGSDQVTQLSSWSSAY